MIKIRGLMFLILKSDVAYFSMWCVSMFVMVFGRGWISTLNGSRWPHFSCGLNVCLKLILSAWHPIRWRPMFQWPQMILSAWHPIRWLLNLRKTLYMFCLFDFIVCLTSDYFYDHYFGEKLYMYFFFKYQN